MEKLFNTLEELAMLGTAFETQHGAEGFITVFGNEETLATITCPDIGSGVFVLTRLRMGSADYSVCHFVLDNMRSNLEQVISQMNDLLLDSNVKPLGKIS